MFNHRKYKKCAFLKYSEEFCLKKYILLTFNGRTSLLIAKKAAIALVHAQRPATLPHTFLAVSKL